MSSPAERIIENYKKNEHIRITGAIHAATALAGAALYKNETGGNEFLFVLGILFSSSAYGFWYLTEVAHARMALWAVEKQAKMEVIRQQKLFQLGLVGQLATFAVLLCSFVFSIVGLIFDFILGGSIGIDRFDAAWIVVAAMVAISVALFWFYTNLMNAIKWLDIYTPPK